MHIVPAVEIGLVVARDRGAKDPSQMDSCPFDTFDCHLSTEIGESISFSLCKRPFILLLCHETYFELPNRLLVGAIHRQSVCLSVARVSSIS